MPKNSKYQASNNERCAFSSAGSGFASVMTRHLISSLFSLRRHRGIHNIDIEALSLLGRLIVARATYPPTVESITGILSTFNTRCSVRPWQCHNNQLDDLSCCGKSNNTRTGQVQNMGEGQPLVKAIDMAKKYGDFIALHPLNVEVHSGEFFGVFNAQGNRPSSNS